MSNVQSLGDSPTSSMGLGNSLIWEKVALSPLEIRSVQLEHELQHTEKVAAISATFQQNKYGVDVNAATGKAAGCMTIEVLAVKDLSLDQNAAVQAISGNAQPQLYVSTLVTPLSAFEKSTKKHLRTNLTKVVDNVTARWQESLVYKGAKTKNFGVKVSLNCKAEVIADVLIGELELRSADYVDQRPNEQWLDLIAPPTAATSGIAGKLLVRVTFEHLARERHERQVALLRQKKRENDKDIEHFKITARLVNAPLRHPAAFGINTARAALYLPGNKFHIDVHHPAAVCVAPLADKTRVVTPFGRGVVVSFRPETKMYVVQMDTDAAARTRTIAYLCQNVVKEEPDGPYLRMHMKVLTPYGLGVLTEVRPHDDVLVVETDFARLYMQRQDVKLPAKELSELSTKDLITEATKLADAGNKEFRNGNLEDAVYSYLRSLTFLQRVDQDTATYKEKAIIIRTMIRCHLNIGACKLKLNMYADAEIACTNALSILTVLAENREGNVVTWMGRLGMSGQLLFEDWPSKAHFRRAQACAKLEKYVDAKHDLLLAVRLNPRDKSCRALLEKVSKSVDKQKRDEMKAWGGIFDTDKASTSPIEPATSKTMMRGSHSEEKSIFTRKTKKQQHKNAVTCGNQLKPWYLTTHVLATASVMAGVAAIALLTLKPKSS